MMSGTQSTVILLFAVLSLHLSHAQLNDLEIIRAEIKEIALTEQEAFKNGDCNTVVSLMADDISFFANGRAVPSKAIVEKFCNSIPRPFQELTYENLDIVALNPNTGYVVRILEFDKDEQTKIKEIVTKIWNKTESGWKMVHLHSTVKEIPISE